MTNISPGLDIASVSSSPFCNLYDLTECPQIDFDKEEERDNQRKAARHERPIYTNAEGLFNDSERGL